MQRAYLRGRGEADRGIAAARRASVAVIGRACLAWGLLAAAQTFAANFGPVTGTVAAKAGSQPLDSEPAKIGNTTAISQILLPPFATGQASLNLQNPNSSRYVFNGSASSLTSTTTAVQASYNFVQPFTTTATQWIELTAKVNANPFGNPGATALVTLGRAGQAPVFSLNFTFGEFDTRGAAFAAGNFELKADVATSVSSGPASRDAQTLGNLLIAAFADFNSNGVVNQIDLATWRAGFGLLSGTFANGNLDDIPAVDARDFLLWQRQYGTVTPAVAAASAIPEPGAAALAALAAAALLTRGRRRGSRRPWRGHVIRNAS